MTAADNGLKGGAMRADDDRDFDDMPAFSSFSGEAAGYPERARSGWLAVVHQVTQA
jgi:hypothetical protein